MVLDVAARDLTVQRIAKTRADVARLWDVCQVPDYRKSSPSAHAELALTLYGYVVRAGHVPDSWFAAQLAPFDRTEGDISTLSGRIAQVRTLTYIANRPDWLTDPEHWQGVTRQLEDRLSDALHERLAQRFVDRRTSVLMRRLRENAMLEAEVTSGGDVLVEGQHVGQLQGFRFTPDPQATGEAARALNAAALKALGGEIESRADRFSAAVDESFTLANDGTIRWLGDPVAKIAPGDKLLAPRARVIADEHLTGPALETVQRRLDLWLTQNVKKHLGALIDIEVGEGLEGISRGIAFQVAEALGVLERSRVAEEMKSLDQASRATLRKLGLRFGAYHIYMPALIKPAPRALAAQLWALRNGGVETTKGLDEVPHFAASGRTSFEADPTVPKGLYRAAGFRVCGTRAVRVDILERLADLIRPAIAYHPGTSPGAPPPGAADRDGFVTTVGMTSLAGCSGEDFASILRSLGYMSDKRPGPAITVPLLPVAPTAPLKPMEPDTATPVTPLAEAEESAMDHADQAADVTAEAASPVRDPDAESVNQPAGSEPLETAPAPASSDPASGTTSLVDVTAMLTKAAVAATAVAAVAVASSTVAAIGGSGDAGEATGPGASDDDRSGAAEPPAMASVPAQPDPPMAPVSPGEQIDPAEPQEPAEPAEPGEQVDPAEPAEPTAPADPAGPGEFTASAEPEAPASAAEPVLIEVWRPHRANHNTNRRPERVRRREPQRTPAGAAPSGSGGVAAAQEPAEGWRAGERRDGPGRGNDRNRDRHPAHLRTGTPSPLGERSAGEAATATTGDRRGPKENGRPQRHGEGKGRFEPRRNDERRGEGGRGGDGRGSDGGRLQSFTTQERPARDRQPDPNSPFAKLAALKLELERKKEP